MSTHPVTLLCDDSKNLQVFASNSPGVAVCQVLAEGAHLHRERCVIGERYFHLFAVQDYRSAASNNKNVEIIVLPGIPSLTTMAGAGWGCLKTFGDEVLEQQPPGLPDLPTWCSAVQSPAQTATLLEPLPT